MDFASSRSLTFLLLVRSISNKPVKLTTVLTNTQNGLSVRVVEKIEGRFDVFLLSAIY